MKTNPDLRNVQIPELHRRPRIPIQRDVAQTRLEQEFAETLRQAAYIFENEEDGRFQGSILACKAVAEIYPPERWRAPSWQAHSCRSPRPSRNVSEEVTHGSSRRNQLLKKKGSVHRSESISTCSQLPFWRS